MWGRWRKAEARQWRGASGYRAYAVGDIHGRLDLFDGLLAQIAADHIARGEGARPLLVLLGDLIDRGPDSRGVLERVLARPHPGFQTLTLCGNHEEALLRLLDEAEPGLLDRWLHFGGDACVRSYGEDPVRLSSMAEHDAIVRLRQLIPQSHQDYLRSLADTFRFGDYLFVHAGIRPGIPLERQQPADLRWIREPFLSDPRDHGMMVVHGHTITDEPDERINRIGIDTGGYRQGVLTALMVDGTQRHWLQQRSGQ
ncbi:metallophosphoesterase [Sphingomonas sp. KRR8]|uniref:metallophosphoesterase n=1 Tax=Sphingomonas sp. KRR8 TaxID=2942996 RepID=UPI0020226490|nr:metallophosphoesterase [Sphingomonas sp. KRR8]URD61695.1 metallophosphoesterase [Sphingomonas sp. KRR8]